ncbi:hypothetical protein TSOC_003218 [Tetrabaena socialis]|uniref:Uncharacterized protein n=1 Tax=Tetrabaena socialis TaxID=47790 RepID=A0A2J8AC26_9CHLO|nr:hypothetical protein TSOC_003218 [Tetrabaena socialis]|eukprot:PNH10082.1 hypothetical protein TSOC_003218 [Tetrabaena socialis]
MLRSDSQRPADPAPKRVDFNTGAEVPEAHKVFDEVAIVVKSGNGGNGEVVPSDRGRWVSNFKYKPGGSQSKTIWLPASEADAGGGGARSAAAERVEEEEGGEEEGLVRMAPADDPDAALLDLSMEELLAMEKDW